ncbi:class I SAM-dependent methyltransferase [Chitinophaga sp. Mgbs1]|uniref:Class I SAM-dependent methyltransferase n=1 Tax=Chitinophaga solisilvae TaxID=1233460 RepID=A0A3S1B180_9BACT|nr:class I SAM-dependent methyltransferase [Chitinophaga solisilvae]
MKQNKYDDPGFFASYSQMLRSVEGLQAAGEWEVFRNMLPALEGKRVLDLGCGFGWHCRYAREQRAAAVTGVDLSARMLERAAALTNDPAIVYRLEPIEAFTYTREEYDVVISSLAFHYIADITTLFRRIYDCLKPGGSLIFSAEHPVFTALPAQDWYYDQHGNRLHWPLDNYQDQGIRHTSFLDNEVIKYHRTVAAWLNALIDAGFSIREVAEPTPSAAVLEKYPEMKDEKRRPIFLMLAVCK